MNLSSVLHLVLLASGLMAAVHGPGSSSPRPKSAPGQETPLRYGRTSNAGAVIRNLADSKGREVARPARGQLVAVYEEGVSGWLEVEVPGGFPVWVFGQYLKPTSDAGLYEVTGNAVNLRPEPSSGVNSFPLPQRLQAGDRVRLIQLQDSSKPLAKTWVRVWSPPGVRGYLTSSALESLAQGEDGTLLWSTALGALPAAPALQAGRHGVVPKSEGEKREAAGRVALDEARKALESERLLVTPDFDPIEKSLEGLVSGGGVVAIEARAELRTLATLREAAALRADLERERTRRSEEVLEMQRKVWENSREKDPLGGVFLARGVVERRTGNDGVERFFLRFGRDIVCELACSSGRYDLSTFASVEVGVHGQDAGSRTGELQTYEISRLEVLAVR